MSVFFIELREEVILRARLSAFYVQGIAGIDLVEKEVNSPDGFSRKTDKIIGSAYLCVSFYTVHSSAQYTSLT